MRIPILLVLLFLALSLTVTAAQAVVYVDCSAPGPTHDGTSWDTAFLTIQEGVDAATPGGDVWVADGTYVENVVMGEGVAIYGGFLGAEPGGYETELDQRDYADNVATIDGNQSGSCVTMAVDAGVDGFTITSGSGTVYDDYTCGGGMYCEDLGDTGHVANNSIVRNTVEWLGGGIYCSESSPAVTGCSFRENTAMFGGGMFCQNQSSPLVLRNLFADNAAFAGWPGGRGGGIYLCFSLSAAVVDNEFVGNWGWDGGAVACFGGSGTSVRGNTIVCNTAYDYGGEIYCYNCDPALADNTIAGNLASSTIGLGGGIYCGWGTRVCATGNTIAGNRAAASGGGVLCNDDSGVTLIGNLILGNSAAKGHGGGVSCRARSDVTLAGNLIALNEAYGYGGGLHTYWTSPSLISNTIYANSAMYGGGVYAGSVSDPTIRDNVVVSNCADEGGGIYCIPASQPKLAGNDFWNNTPDDYDGCEPGEGDISADPIFVDAEGGNWHLSFGSPCIDAGTNDAEGLLDTDWEGEARVYDGDGDQEEPAVYATVDMGADEFVPLVATAPEPQPECQGPLFGTSGAGLPAWVWFSIPLDPDSCCNGDDCYNPATVLGFPVSGRLWRWDSYGKFTDVYQKSFNEWDLAVGEGYLLFLWTDVPNPSYLGISPFTPWTFEHKLGRQGWTWIGMPGLSELAADDFMSSVRVKYPSDETGEYRTAAQDYASIPGNWITWGWPYWNTWRKGAETFTPYAPFGHRTCYPWLGYRVWVKVGTAMSQDDPDQVTIVWPKSQ